MRNAILWGFGVLSATILSATAWAQQPQLLPEAVPAPGTETAAAPLPQNQPQNQPQEAAAEACPGHHRCVGSRWRECIKPRLEYSHWGYCDEFEEVPFGDRLRSAMRTQVCNGMGSQMVLYRYDFCQAAADMAQLNRHGQKRLDEMVRMMQSLQFHTLTIEPSGNSVVDAARKNQVLKALSAREFTVPESAVVVASPEAPGLPAIPALLIQATQTKLTAAGGAQLATSSEGSSGSSGGSR